MVEIFRHKMSAAQLKAKARGAGAISLASPMAR
jgi:hypothetical protein